MTLNLKFFNETSCRFIHSMSKVKEIYNKNIITIKYLYASSDLNSSLCLNASLQCFSYVQSFQDIQNPHHLRCSLVV